MPNLNKIKIPTTNNNKVLTTDENGIIKDTSIDISSVENAVSIKNYYLNLLEIPASTQITNEAYPELYTQLSNIVNDIINEVQLSLFAITDNYHDPVYGSVPAYSAGQINYDTVLKFIDLKFNPNTQLATDQSGISYYTNTTNAIHIQLSESNTITSIMYNSASADTQVEFLTTTNKNNGEGVTYLPEYDSQPANKKYVDQQIANIQSQINSIELTVDDILGQPESTETQN